MVTNPQPSACRKTAPCDRACFVQRFEIAEEDATLPRDDGRLSTLITDRRIVHLHNVVKAISSFHDHSISRIRAWLRHELPSNHVFPANASGSLPYREQLVLHESSDRPTVTPSRGRSRGPAADTRACNAGRGARASGAQIGARSGRISSRDEYTLWSCDSPHTCRIYSPGLMWIEGLRGSVPARPTRIASYSVSVRQVAR